LRGGVGGGFDDGGDAGEGGAEKIVGFFLLGRGGVGEGEEKQNGQEGAEQFSHLVPRKS